MDTTTVQDAIENFGIETSELTDGWILIWDRAGAWLLQGTDVTPGALGALERADWSEFCSLVGCASDAEIPEPVLDVARDLLGREPGERVVWY